MNRYSFIPVCFFVFGFTVTQGLTKINTSPKYAILSLVVSCMSLGAGIYLVIRKHRSN